MLFLLFEFCTLRKSTPSIVLTPLGRMGDDVHGHPGLLWTAIPCLSLGYTLTGPDFQGHPCLSLTGPHLDTISSSQQAFNCYSCSMIKIAFVMYLRGLQVHPLSI